MATKYALPLTFLFVYGEDEPAGWCALACEIDVASDGRDLDEARWMIRDAVGLWTTVEIEEGRGDHLSRPVPPEELIEFIGDAPPDRILVEYYTLLLTVEAEPRLKVTSLEFVRSSVAPVCYPPRVAA
jgi:predicted RNase H-like HicB family nuclease